MSPFKTAALVYQSGRLSERVPCNFTLNTDQVSLSDMRIQLIPAEANFDHFPLEEPAIGIAYLNGDHVIARVKFNEPIPKGSHINIGNKR